MHEKKKECLHFYYRTECILASSDGELRSKVAGCLSVEDQDEVLDAIDHAVSERVRKHWPNHKLMDFNIKGYHKL